MTSPWTRVPLRRPSWLARSQARARPASHSPTPCVEPAASGPPCLPPRVLRRRPADQPAEPPALGVHRPATDGAAAGHGAQTAHVAPRQGHRRRSQASGQQGLGRWCEGRRGHEQLRICQRRACPSTVLVVLTGLHQPAGNRRLPAPTSNRPGQPRRRDVGMLDGASMACGIAYLNEHFQKFWVGEPVSSGCCRGEGGAGRGVGRALSAGGGARLPRCAAAFGRAVRMQHRIKPVPGWPRVRVCWALLWPLVLVSPVWLFQQPSRLTRPPTLQLHLEPSSSTFPHNTCPAPTPTPPNNNAAPRPPTPAGLPVPLFHEAELCGACVRMWCVDSVCTDALGEVHGYVLRCRNWDGGRLPRQRCCPACLPCRVALRACMTQVCLMCCPHILSCVTSHHALAPSCAVKSDLFMIADRCAACWRTLRTLHARACSASSA